MSPRHRTRPAWRDVDPYAVAFGAVCGLLLAGGIIAILAGSPVPGIG